MIISHKYRFIFIKTKKTAGTSMEIALSRFLGPRDVITHISPEDEAIRQAAGYRGPQNFLLPWHRLTMADWRHFLRGKAEAGRPRRPYFYNHMPADEIRSRVGRRVWDTYYKFCFERNPWDKVISWYYWEHRDEPRPDLKSFIEAGRARELAGAGGEDLYRIDGQVAVDRIYKYEELEAALEDITERLNLPALPELPRAKSQVRKDKRPYQEIYGEERQLVAELFARQIEEIGYRF